LLDDFVIRVVSRTAPGLVPGGTLHRRALAAAEARRWSEAEERFEAAAAAYRVSLDVEGLARLRVHQRMARARATHDPVREAEMMLEIVRGLNRLDRLESFRAPHEMRDARSVLSEWLAGSGAAFDADAEGARLSA
jgi:predicted metal-dependent hydrolase